MFNFLKKTLDPGLSEEWKILENPQQIDAILNDKQGCYLIYKHSYRCSTCLFTMQSLQRHSSDFKGVGEMYFVDVIKQREISNHIAKVTGVRHESPQALLIYKGHVFWHDSHSGVRGETVIECLNELFPG
jgi:bacillithiol system protein YtxJ